MNSSDGFIHHLVRVSIKLDREDVKEFNRQLVVLAPFDSVENLSISVCGSVDKTVLLHGGKVYLTASIDRKGYAPGESIPVTITVRNGSSAKLALRLALQQIQIFMSGARHKTVDNLIAETDCEEADSEGQLEIEPNNNMVDQVVPIKVPTNCSLSIKNPIITVKYFIAVSLDIPHSFDLHLNLPVVITHQSVVDQIVSK